MAAPGERVENCLDNDVNDANALCRSVFDSTNTSMDVEFLGEMLVTGFTIEGCDAHLGAFKVLLMDIDGNSVTCYDHTFGTISPYPTSIHQLCNSPGPATAVRLLLPGTNRRIALKEFYVHGKPTGARISREELSVTNNFNATVPEANRIFNGLLGMPMQSMLGFSSPSVTLDFGGVVELETIVIYNTERNDTRGELGGFHVSVTPEDDVECDDCMRFFNFTNVTRYPLVLQIPFSRVRTSAVTLTLDAVKGRRLAIAELEAYGTRLLSSPPPSPVPPAVPPPVLPSKPIIWPIWASTVSIASVVVPPMALGAILVAASTGGLGAMTILSLNHLLRFGYAVLCAWGVASVVWGFANEDHDNVVHRLNLVIYMIISTVAHLGITAASPFFIKSIIRYGVRPKALYQGLDFLMFLSLGTVLAFLFDPDGLFTVALSGGVVTTMTLGVQFYKVNTIVQEIESGERSDLTAKLLSGRYP